MFALVDIFNLVIRKKIVKGKKENCKIDKFLLMIFPTKTSFCLILSECFYEKEEKLPIKI